MISVFAVFTYICCAYLQSRSALLVYLEYRESLLVLLHGPCVCLQGVAIVAEDDFCRVRAFFALYSEDQPLVLLEDYVEEYCMQGYSCLLCPPGTFEDHWVCTP